MLIIKVNKDEGIERALKKFKRKFIITGTINELREREQFVKKSAKRRSEIKKAIYIRKTYGNQEE
jgi:small subunit ribosomal protein S21